MGSSPTRRDRSATHHWPPNPSTKSGWRSGKMTPPAAVVGRRCVPYEWPRRHPNTSQLRQLLTLHILHPSLATRAQKPPLERLIQSTCTRATRCRPTEWGCLPPTTHLLPTQPFLASQPPPSALRPRTFSSEVKLFLFWKRLGLMVEVGGWW